MPQSLAYQPSVAFNRNQRKLAAPQYARPYDVVDPILDATNPLDMVRQVLGFIQRHQGYRIGVPNTSFFPFSAICRLNLTFPSGPYHGTGFYISPRLILTCGHNLFDKTPDRTATEYCSHITVRVGQQDASTWLGTFDLTSADFDAHPTWISSATANKGFDLGILRVPYGPPDGKHFNLINHSIAEDTPIAVCGYGDDTGVDGQKQHLDIDKVREYSADFESVSYNLQTRGGNSGSPIFAYYTGGADLPETVPVMGVHTRSQSNTLNRGVLLTPDKIDWAMGGGNSSVSAFSLGNRPAAFGGLPLSRVRATTLVACRSAGQCPPPWPASNPMRSRSPGTGSSPMRAHPAA